VARGSVALQVLRRDWGSQLSQDSPSSFKLLFGTVTRAFASVTVSPCRCGTVTGLSRVPAGAAGPPGRKLHLAAWQERSTDVSLSLTDSGPGPTSESSSGSDSQWQPAVTRGPGPPAGSAVTVRRAAAQ
jgi:hypothetical protein